MPPKLRIVPEVPITWSKPCAIRSSRYSATSRSMCFASLRSAEADSGSACTNRSVSRMTPILKLRAKVTCVAEPSVISTLPPPMSITTASPPDMSTPYAAAKWISRASSVLEMTFTRTPVSRSIRSRKAGALSASRTALVAEVTISSTLCASARRLNLDSACSAVPIAVSVRARPSRPPPPSRTISFSRSITSNARSDPISTTIMWMELVPMSIVATRIRPPWQRGCKNCVGGCRSAVATAGSGSLYWADTRSRSVGSGGVGAWKSLFFGSLSATLS